MPASNLEHSTDCGIPDDYDGIPNDSRRAPGPARASEEGTSPCGPPNPPEEILDALKTHFLYILPSATPKHLRSRHLFKETVRRKTLRKKYRETYKTWMRMRARCNSDRKLPDARSYKEKGIRVCARWEKSFEHFLEDMGPKPEWADCIDRYPDPWGDYAPHNCRWATDQQNADNKITAVIFEYQGRKLYAREVADLLKIPRTRVYDWARKGLTVPQMQERLKPKSILDNRWPHAN